MREEIKLRVTDCIFKTGLTNDKKKTWKIKPKQNYTNFVKCWIVGLIDVTPKYLPAQWLYTQRQTSTDRYLSNNLQFDYRTVLSDNLPTFYNIVQELKIDSEISTL